MDLISKLKMYRENSIENEPRITSDDSHKWEKDIDVLVPGMVVKNDDGNVYVVENAYPLSYLYGGCSLGDGLSIESSRLAELGGKSCEGLEAKGLLYMDTETTGLSGGTGTVAFLVGAGFFTEEYFIIRQYFMRDYDEEAAMLTELKELFHKYKGFVTFNGKAFDINLLNSRFISNRIKASLTQKSNIDLLYPSRKVWGLKLESCRLSSLEQNILGEYRCDDIPGALIPSAYFKYLDDRDATEMIKVIGHNRQDILSMVSLLVKLSTMLESPMSQTDGEYELLGLGRIFEANGNVDSMVDCLEVCADSERYLVRARAIKKLTSIYKREGHYNKALEHWESLESEDPGFGVFHLVEMAKYYEHKAKDIESALAIVDKAINKCLCAGLSAEKQIGDLKKRKERLLGKRR